MKSLADRILDLIPDTAHGLSLREAISLTEHDRAHVNKAFLALENRGDAKIVKRGRGGAIYLMKPTAGCVCVVCKKEFQRKPKSKRLTCSSVCHVKLSWRKNPDKRIAGIRAAVKSPARVAFLLALNKRRWDDPEQHKKLSEFNSKRAALRRADPEAFERYRAMMRVIQTMPEKKSLYSNLRKQWWADPVMRKKMTDAVNASAAVQAYRKNYGEHMRLRWKDPELRAKYIASNVAKNNDPRVKKLASERMKKRWESPEFVAKIRAVMKEYSSRPDVIETRRVRMKNLHETPAFRRKYKAGIKRAQKRKREQAEGAPA